MLRKKSDLPFQLIPESLKNRFYRCALCENIEPKEIMIECKKEEYSICLDCHDKIRELLIEL